MSTSDTGAIETTPTRSRGTGTSDGSRRRDALRQKNTRSPARGEQVPSDPSLGWLLFMITGDTEDVNSKIASRKKARPTARAGRVPSETSLGWLNKW